MSQLASPGAPAAPRDAGLPPRLRARLTGDLALLMGERPLLTSLLDGFGSPLNIVVPAQLRATTEAFRLVLAEHGLRYRLFLAHKANRSAALIRQAAVEGLDLDAASHGELCSGLAGGFPGARMEATGPKNPAFLRLAVQHGLLIHVDNPEELTHLDRTSASLGNAGPVDVVLRIAAPAAGDTGSGTGVRADTRSRPPRPARPWPGWPATGPRSGCGGWRST